MLSKLVRPTTTTTILVFRQNKNHLFKNFSTTPTITRSSGGLMLFKFTSGLLVGITGYKIISLFYEDNKQKLEHLAKDVDILKNKDLETYNKLQKIKEQDKELDKHLPLTTDKLVKLSQKHNDNNRTAYFNSLNEIYPIHVVEKMIIRHALAGKSKFSLDIREINKNIPLNQLSLESVIAEYNDSFIKKNIDVDIKIEISYSDHNGYLLVCWTDHIPDKNKN